MKIRALGLTVGVAVLGCHRMASPVPKAGLSRSGGLSPSLLQEVERQTFELVAAPASLPRDIRAGLARELGQSRLSVAAASEPWASGCLEVPGLPHERLRYAAI